MLTRGFNLRTLTVYIHTYEHQKMILTHQVSVVPRRLRAPCRSISSRLPYMLSKNTYFHVHTSCLRPCRPLVGGWIILHIFVCVFTLNPVVCVAALGTWFLFRFMTCLLVLRFGCFPVRFLPTIHKCNVCRMGALAARSTLPLKTCTSR